MTRSREGRAATRPAADEAAPLHSGRLVVVAVVCAAFVIAAVLLEMASGAASGIVETRLDQRFVPLLWPQGWRVIWWLVIAGAAATHRLALDRLYGRQRWWLGIAYAAPFLAFASGVAVRAPWATFH
ncbi:MAG: hypothetical protein ACYCS7_08300 [Acidimicrobiales bacterium]